MEVVKLARLRALNTELMEALEAIETRLRLWERVPPGMMDITYKRIARASIKSLADRARAVLSRAQTEEP